MNSRCLQPAFRKSVSKHREKIMAFRINAYRANPSEGYRIIIYVIIQILFGIWEIPLP